MQSSNDIIRSFKKCEFFNILCNYVIKINFSLSLSHLCIHTHTHIFSEIKSAWLYIQSKIKCLMCVNIARKIFSLFCFQGKFITSQYFSLSHTRKKMFRVWMNLMAMFWIMKSSSSLLTWKTFCVYKFFNSRASQFGFGTIKNLWRNKVK